MVNSSKTSRKSSGTTILWPGFRLISQVWFEFRLYTKVRKDSVLYSNPRWGITEGGVYRADCLKFEYIRICNFFSNLIPILFVSTVRYSQPISSDQRVIVIWPAFKRDFSSKASLKLLTVRWASTVPSNTRFFTHDLFEFPGEPSAKMDVRNGGFLSEASSRKMDAFRRRYHRHLLHFPKFGSSSVARFLAGKKGEFLRATNRWFFFNRRPTLLPLVPQVY